MMVSYNTTLIDSNRIDFICSVVATFGFDRGQYSVVENEMFVTVTIRQVSGGPLNRNVFITLETGDGTAICELLFT